MAESGIPDVETQKEYIKSLIDTPLKKGDNWFIIDIKWIKQWKCYVGFESWDSYTAGKESANPGPIDNKPILKEGSTDTTLREHLIDDLDYFLLPEEAWNKLLSWYGITKDQKGICRKVIEEGVYSKSLKVEVYPWCLKIYENSRPDEQILKEFSRADTVGELEKAIRQEFNVPEEKETRLWNRYMTNMYEQLKKKETTIQDAGLYSGTVVVLEQKNEDGSWPRESATNVKGASTPVKATVATMALSLDDSKLLSSDETPDNFCDPCKFRGIQANGCHYCRICAENLCSGCKDYHKSFKATRNHTVVSSTHAASYGHNESQFKVFCTCDQSLEVAIYCESHNEVACITCKSVKHRKCSVIKLHEKGLNYKVSNIQSTIQNAHSLEDEIEQFQQDRHTDVQRIESTKEKSREKIKIFRKDFDMFFDKLENDMVTEIEEKAAEMRSYAEQHIPTCTNTLKLLNNDLKMLDVASKSSNTDMAYAADVKISKRLTELRSMLKDFQDEVILPKVLEFEENQKLLDLKDEVKTLGSLRVKE